MKVRMYQVWVDKRTGNRMIITSRNRDGVWNGVLEKSRISHKITEKVLNKYFTLTDEKLRIR